MLWWFAQTALIAAGLVVLATLAGRWKRLGPEARHALWLVVLIKLAIPPVVAWPWGLPDAWPARVELASAASPAPPVVEAKAASPTPQVEAEAASPTPRVEVVPEPPASLDLPADAGPPPSPEEVLGQFEIKDLPAPSQESQIPIKTDLISADDLKSEIPDSNPEPQARKSEIWNWRSALIAFWLAGSVVVVARRGIKILRFHRSLARSEEAPEWLVEEVREIGERVGVRPPPVLVTSSIGTPLLWCLGRPRLILPEALIKRLEADRWSGILAHELAHLARCDHWVVRLELLVEAVWWWNPLFWHARRRLHEEAELACDARVIRSLPERRFAYAEALVDVCEHLARTAIPAPALGVGGAGASRSLEGRLLMILGDPIPRRPSRRATLAALFLAALALPAWTLGQQPDEPKPKQEPSSPSSTPKPEPSPKPDAPPTSEPLPKPDASPKPESSPFPLASELPTPVQVPAPSAVTIETIVAARTDARQGLVNLSFRYIVVGRDQSHNDAYNYGNMGGGERSLKSVGPKIIRRKAVHVQVADVVLGFNQGFNDRSRLDVIEARPRLEPPKTPEQPSPFWSPGWDRRFVAKDKTGYMTLETDGDKDDPVPFRWLGAKGRGRAWGDSLTSAFFTDGSLAIEPDKGIDPLNPRPANILDFTAGSFFLNEQFAHAEVVGVETIDGRDVVRVAWIANTNGRLRGLCWLAPDLAYAVVRSDATMDPNPSNVGPDAQGRRSWRQKSSDFVQVGNLWLPRKVTYEVSEADPAGGEPLSRSEREMIFEDYRVGPTVPDDTFRPKLAIEALDDLSGNFTAKPPALPPGLVDRLKRAVKESKFGPPIDERTTEEYQVAAKPSNTPPKPGEKPGAALPKPGESPARLNMPGGRAGEAIPNPGQNFFDPKALPFGQVAPPSKPTNDAAKADPGIIARPVSGFEDPIPVSKPKVDDPIPIKNPADQAALDALIDRRLKSDPDLTGLEDQWWEAKKKLDDTRKITKNAGDPALTRAQSKLEELQTQYRKLREAKSREIRQESSQKILQSRDEVELFQFRRDGKAAEMKKAEAHLELANSVWKRAQALRAKGSIDQNSFDEAQAGKKIAEAEVARKKSELDEAELLVKQTRRRVEPDADPIPSPTQLPLLPGLDDVNPLQFRRDGKAAEMKKAEAQVELAKVTVERIATLKKRGADLVSKEDAAKAEAELKIAEAEFASRKAGLDEAEFLLSQARHRVGASNSERKATKASTAPSSATLPELRDAIELMEAQLQGKQAELRGAESKAARANKELQVTKGLADKQGVSQKEVALYEDTFQVAQAEADSKKAEVLEFEIRVKQARRRAEAEEGRLKREVARVKDRLKWSEDMFKKGFVSKATFEADRATYDEMMIQLDPKYVPTHPQTEGLGP